VYVSLEDPRVSRIAFVLCLGLLAVPASAGPNLVENGNFEKPNLAGWHARLADYVVRTERKDGKRKWQYYCGCKAYLGPERPWAGLFCYQCNGFMGGEESGKWYRDNHTCVSVDRGKTGRCVKFTLPKDVGNNQGVRLYSRLIRVPEGEGYKISFDAKANRSNLHLFVECHRKRRVPDDFVPYEKLDPTGKARPIDRIYRVNMEIGTPKQWQHFSRGFTPPKRYRFEWMHIKLYAYMPGEAWFDNVKLEKMTEVELREYLQQKQHKVKDSRFKYR
jgi:hypothetical protein